MDKTHITEGMMQDYKTLAKNEQSFRRQKEIEYAELMRKIGHNATYWQLVAMAYYECLHDKRLLHLLPVVNECYQRYDQLNDSNFVIELMTQIQTAKQGTT
jgi:hypothetical protein